jgi:hypothetical protein
MISPDGNPAEAFGLSLQDGEIPDTAFMSAGGVIDDKNIARGCTCHHF